MSRYAAKLLEPYLPLRHADDQRHRQRHRRILHDLDHLSGCLIDPRWRLLVVVGFCGAFTTFSSYAYESMAYFEQGQWHLMLANIFSNNILCLVGALGRHGAGEGEIMANGMAVQVTIYLQEDDKWQRRPLHMEILNFLREENVYAAGDG